MKKPSMFGLTQFPDIGFWGEATISGLSQVQPPTSNEIFQLGSPEPTPALGWTQAELGKNVVLERKLETLSQQFEETLGQSKRKAEQRTSVLDL